MVNRKEADSDEPSVREQRVGPSKPIPWVSKRIREIHRNPRGQAPISDSLLSGASAIVSNRSKGEISQEEAKNRLRQLEKANWPLIGGPREGRGVVDYYQSEEERIHTLAEERWATASGYYGKQ